MSRLLPAALAALLLLPCASRGDRVDEVVASLLARHRFAGLSLAVVNGGRIVRVQGYGLTAGEHSPPVTPDTLFQAGSVSKPVAAMGALFLVEKGKLTLDGDVNLSLKSWQVPENQFTKDSRVTLREILSHTAGFTVHGFGGYPVGNDIPSLVDVLDGRGNSEPVRVDTVPGTKWRYSGGGYEVMQQMVMDATGRPFPQFMREAVLAPLGMRSSGYEQPMAPSKEGWAATGHRVDRRPIAGRWHVYPEMAAAGLWTTPSDLARFLIAVQSSYAGTGNPVLSRDMTRQMLTVQMQDDGLGLLLAGLGPNRRFWHNGRNAGFDTLLVGYVCGGFGAALMINQNDDSGALNKVAEAIAQEYAWTAYPVRQPDNPIADEDPAFTRRIREILEGFAQGRFDALLFTARLAEDLHENLNSGFTSVLKRGGAIKSLELLDRRQKGAFTVHRYRIAGESDSFIATFAYDSDGKIAGVGLKPE